MLILQRMNCLRLLRSVRPKPLFNTSAVKYVSQHPSKFLETQDRWKEKDGIPNQWHLIYKAPMENILNYATVYLTLSTVIVAGSCVYYAIFLFDKDTYNDPLVVGDDVVIADSALEALIYFSAFILFHIVIKVVLSKYVVRLYQNGNDYLAVYRGHWFNSIEKHRFQLKDFQKLKPIPIITWSDAKYSLGTRQGILFENYFKTPHDYNYLLYKKKVKSINEEQEYQ